LVDTEEGLAQLREEIFIMCQLDHPNIVRLEEVYESHSEIYLVQELCLGGELFDRLDEQPDYHYTEAECARLVKQMLCAVRYLHSRGIIHRDLKLENFLFSSTDQDSELKLIDFGLSKHFRYGEVQHEAVGTPYTVSPEVIKGCYDERCDIWAVGVIAFLLLSGEPPFGGCGGPEPLVQVRSNILNGRFEFEPADIWDLVSDKARHFINSLLVVNPKDRPTASQAQKHEWLIEWANRLKTDDDHILNPNVVRALVNFKEFSDMRKLLSEVLSFTLLPDQIKDLRKEFEKMDTDGSGEISLVALKQVLVTNAGAGSLGALTEEEVEDIFNAMRVKKSETRIHWHEFIAAGLSQCEVDDRNLRLAFDRLDGDHKGYITLDDIMDLIGSESLQSEEAMRTMWRTTLTTCNARAAHITYEDFLLIMKGQTRECNDHAESFVASAMAPRVASTGQLDITSGALPVVQEEKEGELFPGHFRPKMPCPTPLTPTESNRPAVDAPLSMDDDDDMPQLITRISVPILSSPTTPSYLMDNMGSPQSQPEVMLTMGELDLGNQSNPEIGDALPSTPGIPSIPRPGQYRRQKSKSLDDSEMNKSFDLPSMLRNDARRAVALPETDREVREELGDKNYSALQVNRKLYRAHRQMRLSVMDACKRFEEQQARHARDVLLAQKAQTANNKPAAGLVMRRVENKTVTSLEVKQLLKQNQKEQQDLMEKANRRGGRGRRTRKKTISDMSSMMGSLSAEEMTGLTIQASDNNSYDRPSTKESAGLVSTEVPTVIETRPLEEDPLAPPADSTSNFRLPTVPGNFKKVKNDPFSGLLGPDGTGAAK
jgi:calcium-dependent protein kinase